jgi:hypothetical protein
VGDYALPKMVGTAQIAYSEAWQGYQRAMTHHFWTGELFDELGEHGIRAIRLWLTVPFDDGMRIHSDDRGNEWTRVIFEDIRYVWEHPDIDVIVVILTDPRHTAWETDCDGRGSMTWINDPVEEFARFMFEAFPHIDKTVIIANTETDNQWRGFKCNEPNEMIWDSVPPAKVEECLANNTAKECVREFSMWRFEYALRQVEKRQRIVQEVRAEYPYATLRLRTAMTISVFSFEQAKTRWLGQYALRHIRGMRYKPDYIGISYWRGARQSLTWVIQEIRRVTGYPAERLFLDQIGQNEKHPGAQYERITNLMHEAWENGVNLGLVWIWKTTWPIPQEKDKGMFEQLCRPPDRFCGWGEPHSGLQAIIDLNEEAQGGAK